MLLTNVCESFNSYILRARDKPILTMCEWIRRQLMKRFVSMREGMSMYNGTLTPKAIKRIETAKEEGLKLCRVHWGGDHRYEVDHMGRTFVVDLAQRSCGYNKWDLTGIPCSHAICCIMKSRLKVDDFVHRCYNKETYMKAYKVLIKPVPGEKDWEKTAHRRPEAPKYVVQPGRPKRARRKEVGEETSRKQTRVRSQRPKCSHCGQEGHYKNHCLYPLKPSTEPPKSPNCGGRPKNPKTVQIGSQKRKYIKKGQLRGGQPLAQPSIHPPVQPSIYEEMMSTFNLETHGLSPSGYQTMQASQVSSTHPRKHAPSHP